MQTFMLKLDRWLRAHRRVVIGTWLVLVVAAAPLAAKQSEHLGALALIPERVLLAKKCRNDCGVDFGHGNFSLVLTSLKRGR